MIQLSPMHLRRRDRYMALEVFIDNDNVVRLTGLRNVMDPEDTYLNAATVEMTLKNHMNQNVAGQTWPSTMAYVTDSDGDYIGQLEDGIALGVGPHKLAVHVDAGSDKIANFTVVVKAVRREVA